MGQKRLLNAVVNIGKSGDSGRDTEAGEEGLSLQYSPKKSFLRFFPNILTFITHHLKCWTTFGKFWHRPINHERGIFQIWNLKSLKYLYSPIVANLKPRMEVLTWNKAKLALALAPNLPKQAKKWQKFKKMDWKVRNDLRADAIAHHPVDLGCTTGPQAVQQANFFRWKIYQIFVVQMEVWFLVCAYWLCPSYLWHPIHLTIKRVRWVVSDSHSHTLDGREMGSPTNEPTNKQGNLILFTRNSNALYDTAKVASVAWVALFQLHPDWQRWAEWPVLSHIGDINT